MSPPVDLAFTRALPKAELHAHLTGSISAECLHEIWKRKGISSDAGKTTLADPLLTIRPEGAHQNIFTFFKLFDTYIYELCNDLETVKYATSEVLKAFQDDGVRYLELRTTPREALASGMTKQRYVSTVLDAIEQHGRQTMPTYLILSIDRRNTLQQALEVVELAIEYRHRGVVGVDLCGNPLKGDVSIFAPAFAAARAAGLRITLHFAEVPESSSTLELETLLSFEPGRIGHVINVPPEIESEVERRQIGLELCLSCNVHAKMISGGFRDHHFGKWLHRECPIILCTDDVGVFGSPLSNEYLLAAQHFSLDRTSLIALSRRSIPAFFGPACEKAQFARLLDAFESRG